jgi:hypothetical protein
VTHSESLRRSLYHGAVLAGLLFFAYVVIFLGLTNGSFGYDAYAYWHVNLADPYTQPLGSLGFFPYSPVAATVLFPLTLLPWPLFVVAWWGLLLAAVAYLGRRSMLVLLAFPPVAIELYHGNIHLLLAAAVVLGFRYPAAWSVVLLTKVTPGIGLLWFAVRREWRSLAIAIGATAALTAVSAIVMPNLWAEWVGVLAANAGAPVAFPAIPIPLWLRLPVAALIVVWGARRDLRWTVPLAATIALPVLWIAGLSMLVGCWPLLRAERAGRYDAGDAEPQGARSATGQLAPAGVDSAAGVQRGVADRAGA